MTYSVAFRTVNYAYKINVENPTNKTLSISPINFTLKFLYEPPAKGKMRINSWIANFVIGPYFMISLGNKRSRLSQ